MDLLLLAATLTWNLVRGVLFIGLPSEPVTLVCVHEDPCVVPANPVVVVVPWDGPVAYVKARYRDGSWTVAVAMPNYQG